MDKNIITKKEKKYKLYSYYEIYNYIVSKKEDAQRIFDYFEDQLSKPRITFWEDRGNMIIEFYADPPSAKSWRSFDDLIDILDKENELEIKEVVADPRE